MSVVHENQLKELNNRLKSIENRLGGMTYDTQSVVRAEIVDNSQVVEQSQTQFGMYIALVVETIDIWKQGRVRWFSPLFHKVKMRIKELPWALPISSMGGFDDCGLTWVPPAGSTIALIFEAGNRACPYYLGTTWHRNRGPNGAGFNYPNEEFSQVWSGKRDGYMVGPDDGSQVFPPWNTENYNGYDLTSIVDFANNPEAQRLITYPNIYGFKTPEKHMIKMVDGDPKCNNKWKRFEIMSSRGNWMMLKDDHLHYAGQWANPQCGVRSGETSCVEGASESSLQDVAQGGLSTFVDPSVLAKINDITPKYGKKKEETSCEGEKSNSKIIGGHPDTAAEGTKYIDQQQGSNPFFKHRQECKPYKGPPTPLNPVCDLPQTGIQLMSISGHTMVMDDSVEEPKGDLGWRDEFNFGCNDKYAGRTYWKSSTGHLIEMSDVEEPKQVRNEYNWIKLLSAAGNKIELNDHSKEDCIAGEQRGIHLQSTSNHTIDMVDETNEQCSPQRMDGGTPVPKSKKAYIRIRSGYGLEMTFKDDNSQEETQTQNIQIFCPHKDNTERGPHIHRYQEAPSGPGLVLLRVGGNYIVSTYDNHLTIVGDEEQNPSDLIEVVTKVNLVYTKEQYINISDKMHLFLAKDMILLLAGEDADYEAETCEGDKDPRVAGILVYDFCSGCVRISDRVYASTSGDARPVSIFDMLPFNKNCSSPGE